jgi:hypothetical protein
MRFRRFELMRDPQPEGWGIEALVHAPALWSSENNFTSHP